MTDQIKEYLAAIGRRGGQASGKSKVRGDSDYYRRISEKAAAARKRKKAVTVTVSDTPPDQPTDEQA